MKTIPLLALLALAAADQCTDKAFTRHEPKRQSFYKCKRQGKKCTWTGDGTCRIARVSGEGDTITHPASRHTSAARSAAARLGAASPSTTTVAAASPIAATSAPLDAVTGSSNPDSDGQCAKSLATPVWQKYGTTCCWILSALEGARAQRILTADNLCGKYSMQHKAEYPAWQELAEHQMAENHDCDDMDDKKSWQQNIQGAAMWCHTADVLPKKFKTFGLDLKHEAVYTADTSIARDKARGGFFTADPPSGAFIYT